ncbi:hypothetical protein ACIRU3_43640 [Streptomyces sp. NPDC101151]
MVPHQHDGAAELLVDRVQPGSEVLLPKALLLVLAAVVHQLWKISRVR